jgi:predicted metallopeptidase
MSARDMAILIQEKITQKPCEVIELIKQSFPGLYEDQYMVLMQKDLQFAPEHFLESITGISHNCR